METLAKAKCPNTPADTAEVHRRANSRQQEQVELQRSTDGDPQSLPDARSLLHERPAHQVELEMQNAELKETRNKLEARLERYAELYDFAPMACLSLDREGIIAEANLACASLLGVERSRLLTQRFDPFVDESERPAFNALLQLAFETRAEQTCEIALQKGAAQPGLVQVRLQASKTGRACHAVLMGLDEHKRVEAALRASGRRAIALVNAVTEPILLIDLEGTILAVNPAMARRLQLGPVELLGKNVYEVHPPEVARRQKERAQEVIRSGQPLRFEDEEGGAVFDCQIYPALDAGGKVTALAVFALDITTRKQAEEARREHLAQLDAFYQTAPLGLCLLDENLRFVRVNEALAAFDGVPASEHLGRTVREIVPHLAGTAEAMLRQVAATGQPVRDVEITSEIPAQPGAPCTWVTQWSPVRLSGGSLLGVHVIVQEISSQKRAEQMLREARDTLEKRVQERTTELQAANAILSESEERFRNLFASAPLGIALHDSRGHYLKVNQAYQDMTGYSEEELLRLGVKGVTHPEDIAEGRRLFAEMRDGMRKQYQRQKRYLSRAGELVWAVSTASAVHNANGDLLYLISVVQDITQRRSAEEALRQSQQKYRELVEHTNSIILRWNRDGQVTFLNEFGQASFGYDEKSIVGRNLVGTIVPEIESTGRNLRRLISQISAHPEGFERNVNETICRDGRRLWVAWNNKAVLDEHGRAVEILSIGTDITERRLLQKEMVEIAERERQRIGRDLHDSLGGQLAGAAILSAVLRHKLTDSANPDAAIAEKVLNAIDEAISQTRSLAHTLCPVALDASGLVNGLREFASAASARFDISCRLHADRNHEVGDFVVATHLFRIVEEAVTNAVRHGKARRVIISLRKLKGQVALEVRDDGVGLSASPPVNHGMGLRTMRYRADLLGAQFAIESGPAGGTRVSCRLPVGSASSQPVPDFR